MGFIHENDGCDDREQIKEKIKGRPASGVAGDDSDIGLLRLAGSGGVGSQADWDLLVSQVLSRHNAVAVLHLLSVLLVIYHPDVLGHVFELVGQPLTLYFGQDATLVVISTNTQRILKLISARLQDCTGRGV